MEVSIDWSHADRTGYWEAKVTELLGSLAVAPLRTVAQLPPGGVYALMPYGRSVVSGGELGALLLLHRVCTGVDVSRPPLRIAVVPDNSRTRSGFVDLHLSTDDLEDLASAWRVRAALSGNSPGDLLPAEQSLRKRRKRRKRIAIHEDDENIHLFFPAFRFLQDAGLRPIAARSHLRQDSAHDPAVVFADTLATEESVGLSWADAPDWIILDAQRTSLLITERDLDSLAQRHPGAKILWVLPSTSHRLFSRLQGRAAWISWLPTGHGSSLGPTLTWIAVPSLGTPEDVDELLRLLRKARSIARQKRQADLWQMLRVFRAAILTIVANPVDREVYDEAALSWFLSSTTDELIEELNARQIALASSAPSAASIIEEGVAILRAIADLPRQPMADYLRNAVESAINHGDGLTIVAPTRTLQRAVEIALVRALDTNLGDLLGIGVTVETRRNVRDAGSWSDQPTLWIGYAGPEDIDLAVQRPGGRVTFALTSIERALFRDGLRRWLGRARQAEAGLKHLADVPRRIALAFEQAEKLQRELSIEQDLPSREAIAALLADAEEKRVLQKHAVGDTVVSAARDAHEVRFVEGVRAYFPPAGLLTVIRRPRTEPLELTVSELRPGDQIVLVRRTASTSLYDAITDQLAASPKIGGSAQLLRVWYRALSDAFDRSHLTYERLLQRIREHESRITSSQTVRSWLRGGVIGPRDRDDVDRVAAALAVAQRDHRITEEVKKSIEVLRGIHAKYSRMVLRWLVSRRAHVELSDSEEALLDEYGLNLPDLTRMISVLTVEDVSETAGAVPASMIGRELKE